MNILPLFSVLGVEGEKTPHQKIQKERNFKMKNAKKIVSIALCAIIMVLVFATAASAAEATPFYNNVRDVIMNFYIENGIATVIVDYSGYSGITTRATINCIIDQRVLLFFWSGIYEQTIVTLNVSRLEVFECQVPSGTYRATIECTFAGSGGADDVIRRQLTASY